MDAGSGVGGHQFAVSNLVGTPIVTSFGPLGTFYLGATGGQANGYVALFDSPDGNFSTAEIDLGGYFHPALGPSFPIPDQGQNAVGIWACYAPLPCSEFAPPGSLNPNGGQGGLLWGDGSTNTSAVYLVLTPEPGTLCVFVLGSLALFLMKKTLTH